MQSENWTIYPEKCFEHDSSWAKSSLNGVQFIQSFKGQSKNGGRSKQHSWLPDTCGTGFLLWIWRGGLTCQLQFYEFLSVFFHMHYSYAFSVQHESSFNCQFSRFIYLSFCEELMSRNLWRRHFIIFSRMWNKINAWRRKSNEFLLRVIKDN